MQPPNIGDPKSSLDTPALCVDLDAMEANIHRIVSYCAQRGVGWRPHAKCHKSVDIAKKLVQAGAIGLTCAKLGEAECMARAGIRDLLIANLIVGPAKLARVAALRRQADPILCIDHIDQAKPLSDVMVASGQTIRVILELDIGMDRVGVAPGPAAIELAAAIAKLPGLDLAGIMGYEGHLLTLADPVEKQKRVSEALNLLVSTKADMESRGWPCPIVSCGGTGSYKFAAEHPGITEIQAGGVIFMDEFYRNLCHVEDHDFALTVVATIVSRPTATRAIMDAGRKTMNMELQLPRVLHREGLRVRNLSAEHGILDVAPNVDLPIGERIELVVGYNDWTTVLHNHFFAFRGDRLEAVWPLQARGSLQ